MKPANAINKIFDKAAQLDSETLSNRVSTTTLQVVEKIIAENSYTSFDEVINEVKQEVGTTTQTLFANNQLSQAIVSANGILLPVANTTNITNVFVLTNTGLNFNGTTSLQLLFSGIPNLENVVSSNYKLIIDNNPVPVEAISYQSEINNGKLAVKIFTDGIDLSTSKNIQLSGTFILENDDKIVFSGNASITRSATRELISYTVSGKGTYELTLGNTSVGDTGNHSNNSLDYIPSGYGINRLGIADYRKVEQEVCCYVPGEVSHVENIMAREYKEKTTRRLRRSEDTTTTSKEQEIEKLTDTSTTDRFEMNQEVSSLLAEDTHQGAFVNAGYSNKNAGYSLNAGADFATNTTSEESNSQAVTHAKEITERALDRVVKKAKEEQTYAGKVKFFEQAFEWDLMSYNFYPFYWASKENWASLYNINDIDDPTFRAFLQSGMARVILTVRPGFEEAVNWYMATGQVWNGGQVPTMDDELFVSIIEELRVKEGEVEETWESRVPTSLTVIQAGSIGLNVQGLPCNTDCDDHLLFGSDGNPIKQNVDANGNDVVLGNSQNSTTTTETEELVGGARPIEEGAA
ncbi:predicted protein [Nematostella vectensis]|uniref:Uncharacterized protein n=1 Tax=Nematostella vectensis TaxID=45351 RepID=A7T991_NEMVE|nr:predicted protein [Nematostella vectensis]|eukprot:XP_001619536.1 hypothetical protein NEMVEDRAFT_v1g224083 [Nematostella vectensis]